MRARSSMRGGASTGRVYRTLLAVATSIAVAGCSGGAGEREETPARPERQAPRTAPITSEGPLVAFLGDSLTAGYGVSADEAYPALVGRLLDGRGLSARVVNAGVSGDTSAGGLRRLPWLLRQEPDVVVVGLGANDALRGQPVAEIERNLRDIVRGARAAGAEVLLLGMRIPPNFGPDYAGSFAAIYPRIARDEDVSLVPFLLDGVGGRADLNLPDGIHPNAAGHRIVADTVASRLEPLVRSRSRRAPPSS